MQLDQRTLSRLLAMNDTQLTAFISSLAADAGISPSELGIDAERLKSIRAALGSVTDSDLGALNGIYQDFLAKREEEKRGRGR